MSSVPPVVNRKQSAPWWVWIAVVGIICGAVLLSGQSERSNKEAASSEVTAEMRQAAKSLVENYTANGVISKVTQDSAYVSSDWYSLTFENKKRVAGAIKIHFDAKSYKFVDLHTGKTVAEYGELLGFRVH